MAWRIDQLLALYDCADELLTATLDKTMTRMELNLERRNDVLLDLEGDDAG